MGSPLAPILANLFMDYHEKDWIENAQVVKATFYKRYVDNRKKVTLIEKKKKEKKMLTIFFRCLSLD